MAQRVGRGIALLFLDRGTGRGWLVSSTPRLHFSPGKDPVPILQEAGWAPGPVLMGGKSRPHRDSIPDRPARSQSLYRLSYRAHFIVCGLKLKHGCWARSRNRVCIIDSKLITSYCVHKQCLFCEVVSIVHRVIDPGLVLICEVWPLKQMHLSPLSLNAGAGFICLL